jgi:hypothetical protein
MGRSVWYRKISLITGMGRSIWHRHIAIHYHWTPYSLCYPASLYQSGTISISANPLQPLTILFRPVTAGPYGLANCQAGYPVQYEKFHWMVWTLIYNKLPEVWTAGASWRVTLPIKWGLEMSCWLMQCMKMKDNSEARGTSAECERRSGAIAIWLKRGTKVTIQRLRRYSSRKQDLYCRRWRGNQILLIFLLCTRVFILIDHLKWKKKV